MAAVMFRSSHKSSIGHTRHSALRCGKTYQGNPKQVAKLISMHAKLCKECAAEAKEGIKINRVEGLKNHDPNHLDRAISIGAEFEKKVAAVKMDALHRYYYTQLNTHLTDDYIACSGKYRTPESSRRRREFVTAKYLTYFQAQYKMAKKSMK